MENVHQQTVSWEELISSDKELMPEQKDYYKSKLKGGELFTPSFLQTVLPENIPSILQEVEKAVAAIDAMVARGIPSYASFVRMLRKIEVLLVEHAPDFFDTLPAGLKRKLRDTKIDMPTENEVETEVFISMEQSTGALKGGFTFDMLIRDVLNYSELSNKLAAAYNEYDKEFKRRRKAA